MSSYTYRFWICIAWSHITCPHLQVEPVTVELAVADGHHCQHGRVALHRVQRGVHLVEEGGPEPVLAASHVDDGDRVNELDRDGPGWRVGVGVGEADARLRRGHLDRQRRGCRCGDRRKFTNSDRRKRVDDTSRGRLYGVCVQSTLYVAVTTHYSPRRLQRGGQCPAKSIEVMSMATTC